MRNCGRGDRHTGQVQFFFSLVKPVVSLIQRGFMAFRNSDEDGIIEFHEIAKASYPLEWALAFHEEREDPESNADDPEAEPLMTREAQTTKEVLSLVERALDTRAEDLASMEQRRLSATVKFLRENPGSEVTECELGEVWARAVI